MKFEEAINQTLCKINDTLTQMKFLEQARNVRDNNIYFFTIPENGGTRTFTVGTTKVDFVTGTIVNPDGTAERLKHSLSQYKLEFVHSLSIDTNQDVILRVNDSPKRTITSGFSTQIPWLTFNFIEITCTVNTNIVLFACTNPQAVIGQFKQMVGSQGLNVAQQAVTGELVSIMKGIEGATLRTITVDNNGQLVAVIKGNHSGTQIIVATDAEGRMLITPQYYNPAAQPLLYSAEAVAPHAITGRGDYTVPAGKQAILQAVSVRLRINTAATTPGTRMGRIYIKVGETYSFQIYATLSSAFNTIGQEERYFFHVGTFLQAGNMVSMTSSDDSTGGSIDFMLNANIMQYDI